MHPLFSRSVRVVLFSLLSIFVTLLSSQLYAQSDNGDAARQFGIGQPAKVSDLPPGQLKRQLESLTPQANAKALRWLQDISFTGTDLELLKVDEDGGVYFEDTLLPEDNASDNQASVPVTSAAPQATLDDAFLLHSRPGASNVVYLDFNGHNITGTAWNSGGNTLYAKAYNLDSDPNTFNETERTRIVDIWHRVAEDLAPFDIDVTTQEPNSFDPWTGRILITEDTDEFETNMPSNGAGGVAYVGVFGFSNYHSYYSPALVYFDNLGGGGETYVAEASSHEFGHNLGLSHDGTTSGTTYYGGHGSDLVSWAPIMGNSYHRNITQWSEGEYANANQTQDDIAIITGRLGVVADDHGNTTGSGTALQIGTDGSVISSNPELDPHNVLPENKGVINSETDVDVFTFFVESGLIDLTVNPAWDAFTRATSRRGANLDIGLELRNAAGNLVTSSDPTIDTTATVSATVAAGTYHLLITGVGNTGVPYSDYDSLGQYFINGSVPSELSDNTAPTPNPMTWASVPDSTGENSIEMTATIAVDDISTVQYEFRCVTGGSGCTNSGWQSSNNHTATGLASDTSYTFNVLARDLAGNQTAASGTASATTDAAAPPPPYVDFVSSGETVVAGTVSGSHTSTHTDNGSAQNIRERESGGKPVNRHTYLEHRWSFNISTGVSATVYANAWSSGSTDGDTFDFEYSVNGGSSWNHLFNVSSTNSSNDQSVELAGTPSGAILIRVLDTDQSQGARERNTVFIDHLFIQVANPPTNPPDGGATGFSATAASESQISLNWTDGASNETAWLIDRSPNGSSSWSQVANLSANSENWDDNGLTESTTYYYRVSASNANGSSGFATANATTDDPSAPPPPPISPTGLSANGVSASQIDLDWSHSGSNEDGFRVERSDSGQGNWTVVATLGVNASSYSDTGLPANTTYDYQVAAFNASGESYSAVDSGTTDSAPALSLSANGYKIKGKHHIDLTWSGSNNVDVYRNGNVIASGVNGNAYTDATGRKGGRTYTHQVCEAGSTTACSNTTTTVF